MTPNAEIFIIEISYFQALYLSKFFPLVFPFLPNSSLANGNLADVAGQLDHMVELSHQSQPT